MEQWAIKAVAVTEPSVAGLLREYLGEVIGQVLPQAGHPGRG